MGSQSPAPATQASASIDRPYLLERVGEAAVVQVYADGFRDLPLREKILVWHLAQAAIAGRDIFYDQRYAHNLEMRDVLEAIVTHPADRLRAEGASASLAEAGAPSAVPAEADIDAAALEEIARYTKLF